MASTYTDFSSARATEPDFFSLVDTLKTIEPSAGLLHTSGTPVYTVKTAAPLTLEQTPQIQTAIDTAPEPSEKTQAQRHVDQLSLFEQALAIVNLDLFNHTRSKLVPPLPPISNHDYKQAIKAKVDELAAGTAEGL